jgi:hypothetical protein
LFTTVAHAHLVYARRFVASIGVASLFVSTIVAGQVTRTEEPRGELIYATYCVYCHTTQVHWRDGRLAIDWTSLRHQVRRWQDYVGLGLGEDDVDAVARYLNGRYYYFELPIQRGKAEVPRSRSNWAGRTP